MAGISKSEDRVVSLGKGLAAIPERLLLAHARGEVLFICGAGISIPAGLPDFRQLVLDVYEQLDASTYAVLVGLPKNVCNQWQANCTQLNELQRAEVQRFIQREYDVVLGMLERRLDNQAAGNSSVRRAVAERLHSITLKPAAIHKSLIALANRGGPRAIVTTNFDLLLEAAAHRLSPRPETYSLGSIPRPSSKDEFNGILHIHGALDKNHKRLADFILSDRDFGEFYLRRRIVTDFIYDAARLYHLVLIGYTANDPPMRYLLNAVAADGTRFIDFKERFAFLGAKAPDPVELEDWKGRGITPIPFDSSNDYEALRATLAKWAKISAHNRSRKFVDSELRRIVKKPRKTAEEEDRDLFDHFFRRDSSAERERMSSLISSANADVDWLDAILEICRESHRSPNY